MSRRCDASGMLERALRDSAASAEVTMAPPTLRSRSWASATFSGARHHVAITASPIDRAERWLDSLPEADLPLRGHLVADLIVIERSRDALGVSAQIEVLTLEDG